MASRRNAARPNTGQNSAMAAAAPGSGTGSPAHRAFTMPDLVIARPARQTLIRPDVAPTIPLKQNVPLPNMLLVATEKPPPFPSKRFLTPSVHRITPQSAAIALAPAPEVQAQAEIPSGMRIAPALTDMARLPVPAGPPTPLRHYSVRPAHAASVPYQGGAAPSLSLLSISDNPVLPSEIVAVPVANQAAPGTALQADAGHGGGSANGTGSGSEAKAGTAEGAGRGDGGQGAGGASGSSTGGSGGSSSSGASSSSGGMGSGTLSASNRGVESGGGLGTNGVGSNDGGSAGSGTGGAVGAGDGGTGNSLNANLPGTTALTLPKDGKFGVVVLGSAVAAPYPESSGTLSGKVIYTVYLRVGQRKNWILQYCLPKSAVSRSRVEGTRTPLEAPWPYNIVRLNHAPDSDYLLVHGMVTVDGRFDQLAMVFPQEVDGKDLLLQSLNRWTFRPATRDGEPTPVEVLLIIPREE